MKDKIIKITERLKSGEYDAEEAKIEFLFLFGIVKSACCCQTPLHETDKPYKCLACHKYIRKQAVL